MRPYLGTFVEIGLITDSPANAERAFTHAFAGIELIQQRLSFHNPDSDLSRLNRAAGMPVNCHPLSIRCLHLAKHITNTSQGRFNCTLGLSLVQRSVLPAHDFYERYGNKLVGVGTAADLILDGRQARLARPVLVTLDGIAKGFAIDVALLQLKIAGIKSGWLNAGGDIRVFGDLTLPVSVRDHLGQLHALGGINNAAIATSTSVHSADHPGLVLSEMGVSLPAATWTSLSYFGWRADALTKVAANLPLSMSDSEKKVELAKLGGHWIPLPTGDITRNG